MYLHWSRIFNVIALLLVAATADASSCLTSKPKSLSSPDGRFLALVTPGPQHKEPNASVAITDTANGRRFEFSLGAPHFPALVYLLEGGELLSVGHSCVAGTNYIELYLYSGERLWAKSAAELGIESNFPRISSMNSPWFGGAPPIVPRNRDEGVLHLKLANEDLLDIRIRDGSHKRTVVATEELGTDTDRLFNRAESLYRTAQLESAAQLYARILTLDPKHAGSAQGLARIRDRQKDRESVIKIWSELASQLPYEGAITMETWASRHYKSPLWVRFELASVYLDAKMFERVVEVAEEILLWAPRDEAARRLLAEAYLALGRDEQADALLKELYSQELERISRDSVHTTPVASDAASVRAVESVANLYQKYGRSEKAQELYQRAAPQVSQTANARLLAAKAKLMEKQKRYADAMALYERVHELGDDGEAALVLAEYYLDGAFVAQDLDRAVHWFQQAYGKPRSKRYGIGPSVEFALCVLGRHAPSQRKQIDLALQMCRSAAEAGDRAGLFWQGMQYAAGLGVDEDIDEALDLIRRAKEKNYPDWGSLRTLNGSFATNILIEMERPWFEPALIKLAQTGDPLAQFIAGHVYQIGYGIPKNRELAERWLDAASRQGYSRATLYLGKLYASDKNASAVSRSRELYRRAVEEGEEWGHYYLAESLIGFGARRADILLAQAELDQFRRKIDEKHPRRGEGRYHPANHLQEKIDARLADER